MGKIPAPSRVLNRRFGIPRRATATHNQGIRCDCCSNDSKLRRTSPATSLVLYIACLLLRGVGELWWFFEQWRIVGTTDRHSDRFTFFGHGWVEYKHYSGIHFH
jgi:hypothetical protein